MTDHEQIEQDLATAEATAERVDDERRALRWTVSTDDPVRQERIEAALADIDTEQRPIRSHIGRAVWEPLPERLDSRLREVSRRLQYARRQLKKMRR